MRNWRRESAGACAAISLALAGALALPAAVQPAAPPLLVLLEGDAAPWREWSAAAGWRFLGPRTDIPEKSIDLRIKALEKRIAETAGQTPFDPLRVYLAGQGDGASAVFYTASRLPDLWAAAVAVGGSARPAVDSNRLFGANTANLPVLWLGAKEEEPLAARMKEAGYNLEFRAEPAANAGMVFEWLTARRRDPLPPVADWDIETPGGRQ